MSFTFDLSNEFEWLKPAPRYGTWPWHINRLRTWGDGWKEKSLQRAAGKKRGIAEFPQWF